ncbi:hypothetical protein [Streptomyces sioyaensis]|uniref:hypothetical protein n=1 Tax=Streptomyces sioyaensis TaxID=67364 RepID=UPI0037A461AE
MAPETRPENSPQQLLQKWIGDLPYQLLLLEKALLPEGFPFDYSPASLDALEARLLEHHDSVQDPGKRTEFVESAMAYLGEVLLGTAGGGWGWNTRPVDERPGQPVVRPDPELALSPVAPMLLISYALRVRTGTAFAKEVDRLRRAVTEQRHAVPGWEPVKEHTPHVDPSAPLPEDPALTAWLAERGEGLSAWAEDAFDGAWRWNFHPDTLDWLEAVVRRRFATVEEFDASRDEPFVQGACWYMGEVIRRNKGAVWQYIPFDPDAHPGAPGSRESVWTGVPFVDQPDKRVGGAAVPLGCLRELLLKEEEGGEPEVREDGLRDVLFWFRSSSYAHVGALLRRMGMVSPEKADSVLAEYAEFAHHELPPHEVPDTLVAFGVAVSAHGDDVDDLEESYAGILEEAAALTGGAVTLTDVRLREDEEYGEVLEFSRNGVPVTQQTEHESDDYLDHMAIAEFIGHADPDPGDDTRRFHLVQFVRLKDTNYDSYFVFATPEQATVLEKELGLQLR